MEVEVIVAAAVAAVGGRKQWLAICHRENLKAVVITPVAMATVVIPLVAVMVEGLVMVSPQL